MASPSSAAVQNALGAVVSSVRNYFTGGPKQSKAESLIELPKQNQAILDQQKALAAQLTVLVEQQTKVVKQQQQLFDRLNRLHGQPPEENASTPSIGDATILSHSNRKRKLARWTSEEEQTLITGVYRYGMKAWDTIRENYEVLSGRSSSALKNKWRGLHSNKRLRTFRSITARDMDSIGDEELLATITLDTIADEIFFRIAEYIGGHSLCGVAKMCREVGAVSKKARQKCHDYMISVPLDMNMTEIYTNSRKVYMLPALTWVKERRAKLRSFSVFCNVKEFGIIASVLRVCNTSEMKELSIRHEHSSIIVVEYWHKKVPRTDFISGTNIPKEKSFHAKALECGIQPDLICAPSILGLSIVENALSLEKLSFHCDAEEVSFDFLTEIDSLKELDFGISNFDQAYQDRVFTKLMSLIEQMSTLRKLSLSRPTPMGGIFSLKNVRSVSLEEINVFGMGKHCWCEGVVCPSLKLFRCLGQPYGNGIRQQFPDYEVRDTYTQENLGVTGTKRASEFPCEGVYVPDSCIFEFRGWH